MGCWWYWENGSVWYHHRAPFSLLTRILQMPARCSHPFPWTFTSHLSEVSETRCHCWCCHQAVCSPGPQQEIRAPTEFRFSFSLSFAWDPWTLKPSPTSSTEVVTSEEDWSLPSWHPFTMLCWTATMLGTVLETEHMLVNKTSHP